MLSIRLISTAAQDYYLNLASEDYFLAGDPPPGMWCGKGADSLGLTETVDPEDSCRALRPCHLPLPEEQRSCFPSG